MTYQELKDLHAKYFSLGYLNTDINTKFALISLVCYLKDVCIKKKPDITTYQLLAKIADNQIPEEFIKSLAIIADDFAYGCKIFPTFGINPKEIPNKIKEIIMTYVPF